jgi:UAA transporter family
VQTVFLIDLTPVNIFTQVFVFVTISKFGALNCALIGLGRKMLSLLLSFILYGHTMNAIQTVGLSLSLVAMIANFYEKVIFFCHLESSSFLLRIIERVLITISFCLVTNGLRNFQDNSRVSLLTLLYQRLLIRAANQRKSTLIAKKQKQVKSVL